MVAISIDMALVGLGTVTVVTMIVGLRCTTVGQRAFVLLLWFVAAAHAFGVTL